MISSNTWIIISIKVWLIKIETYFPIRFVLCTKTEILFILKEENVTKLQVYNNIYYYEVGSKPDVDSIGITVSMRKQHNLKTIFTSYDVLNIQDAIAKGFGSIER